MWIRVLAFAAASSLCACAPEAVGDEVAPSVDGATSSLRISPIAFALDDGASAWSDEGRAVDCATGATSTDDAMNVETGLCHYGVWAVDVDDGVVEGAHLTFTWWHGGLLASEPGEGHIAVAVDDVVVFEAHVPIPSEPEWKTVDVPVDVGRGSRVSLHLHNHGANHWGVSPLTVAAGAQP